MPGVREAIEEKNYAEAEAEIVRVARALEREKALHRGGGRRSRAVYGRAGPSDRPERRHVHRTCPTVALAAVAAAVPDTATQRRPSAWSGRRLEGGPGIRDSDGFVAATVRLTGMSAVCRIASKRQIAAGPDDCPSRRPFQEARIDQRIDDIAGNHRRQASTNAPPGQRQLETRHLHEFPAHAIDDSSKAHGVAESNLRASRAVRYARRCALPPIPAQNHWGHDRGLTPGSGPQLNLTMM